MANRSYVYTTDHLPGSSEWAANRSLRSIGEWNYDIPLAFKLLLTGNPIAVRSSIWESDDKIALAGDSQAGLAQLNTYLAKLPIEAKPLVAETHDFFSRPENIRTYFILECGEIFELQGEDLAAQNLELLAELRELPAKREALPVPVANAIPSSRPGLFQRLFVRQSPAPESDPLDPFYSLGLGNWSNILYFQFEEDQA